MFISSGSERSEAAYYDQGMEIHEILKRGVEAWNKWRKEHPEVRPNLSGVDFGRSHLTNVNFSHANLTRAELWHADLSNANLYGCGQKAKKEEKGSFLVP
jgi:hypothetical protein